MPGISIHVVDVSRGLVAAGMRVEVFHGGQLMSQGLLSVKGMLEDRKLAGRFSSGSYRVTFHVADYYRKEGVTLPTIPFLDIVQFEFGIDDPDQHYHLPFKCTPWGFSCFRGGA
jgi:5-hydroxyisourate hydrolase